MKFISKSSNLLIVLRPGLSAQPITGTPAKPTISVRFKDGLAEVQQQELVDLMLVHPGFNGDFICADGISTDPYANIRQPSEPAHTLTDMKFGTPVMRTIGGGQKTVLPPELQKIVHEMAVEMAKSMLPSLVESTLKGLMATKKESIKEVNEEINKKQVVGSECPVIGCTFVGKNANGLRLHSKKHNSKKVMYEGTPSVVADTIGAESRVQSEVS